jgi:hypothetical protein
MARVRYVDEDKRFYSAKQALVEPTQDVLDEYAAAGFLLPPRSVAYRLEGRGEIVKDEATFQRVEDVVKDSREMGLIAWDLIALDTGRRVHKVPTWESASAQLRAASDQLRLDKWANQDHAVEVLIEKDGLRGVVEPPADEFEVRVRPTKGYDGIGSVREVALRIMDRTPDGRLLRRIHEETGNGTIGRGVLRYIRKSADPVFVAWCNESEPGPNQRTMVLFIGDHDPSGLDLERDVKAKLDRYGAAELYDFKRIAVTCAETHEVEESELHSNPAKESDSRWEAYCREHDTDQAWEVESIEPAALAARVRDAIAAEISDPEQWNRDLDAQESDRGRIREMADEWENG